MNSCFFVLFNYYYCIPFICLCYFAVFVPFAHTHTHTHIHTHTHTNTHICLYSLPIISRSLTLSLSLSLSLSRSLSAVKTEWDELALEIRMMNKLKCGKITQEEFDIAVGEKVASK